MSSIFSKIDFRRLLEAALLLAIAAGLLAYAAWQTTDARARLQIIVETQGVKLESVYRMREQVTERSASLLRMAVMQDAFEQDDEFLRFKQQAVTFIVARDNLTAAGLTEAERAIWETGRRLVHDDEALHDRVLALSQGNRREEALQLLLHEVRPMEARILAQLDILIDMLRKGLQPAMAEAAAAQSRALWAMALLAVLLSAFALAGAVRGWRR